MKKRLIIANWKSNMLENEAERWLHKFSVFSSRFPIAAVEIVVCPPFTLLPVLRQQIIAEKLPLKLGAQDVSPFPKGAYTGEVAAEQLAEYASYVIIGHSERRKYFREDEQLLQNKVEIAIENRLTPIFCVQDEHTSIPDGVTIVAYEPVFAIGSGNPDTPENAEYISATIKKKNSVDVVLYGGSVTAKNIASFLRVEQIDGVLVGSGSLDVQSFLHILEHASH